jgi:DNA polymerase elongation subunit (family B)
VSVIHPGIWHDVNVYDINSMYAYIMREREFPVSYKGAWTDEYYPDRLGIYELEFQQPNRKIPPILCDETLREFAYQGSGVFASPEIQIFLENGGQLKVTQGWYFTRIGTPFRDYMQHLWEVRQLAKRNGNRGLDLAAKLLANGLYGKFGQKSERSVIRTLKPGELKRLIDGGAQVKLYNDYVMIKEPAHMENGFVALAAFITSYARAYLYDWLLAAGDDALYCDTDSVHCMTTLPSGLDLGAMKLEKKFADVVYLRKKMYAYRQPDGYEGFVIKGLPTCPLTYEELEDIAAWNQQYCVSYETPPTIREVLLNREQAAKWKKRSFTISAVPVGAKF